MCCLRGAKAKLICTSRDIPQPQVPAMPPQEHLAILAARTSVYGFPPLLGGLALGQLMEWPSIPSPSALS